MMECKSCTHINCPNKDVSVEEAIIYAPEELKPQETANMGLIEVLEKELLYRYERTGITPDQLEKLLKHISGECWLCQHSKPYNLSPGRKLSVCELGYPNKNGAVARIRDKECRNWKLKEFA